MSDLNIKMNAKVLKNMLNIINTLSGASSAHKIKFNEIGISFNSVDPAHVAMIKQTIPFKTIEEYQFKEETEIGLDITKILNSLKNIKKTDLIDIDYIADTNTVYTKIGPFNNKINTLDLEGIPDPKKPILNLPVKTVINLKEFYDFIDQSGKISDYIEISTYNNKLFLFAESDTDQVKIIYDKKDLKQLDVPDKDQVYISLFSIDYLKMIVRHLKTQYNECTLVFGTDNPIEIICEAETLTEVLLAPRIDEEITNKDRVKREYNDIEEIKEEPEVKPEETVKKEPKTVKTDVKVDKKETSEADIAEVYNYLYPNGEKPDETEVKEELKKREEEIKEKEGLNKPEKKFNCQLHNNKCVMTYERVKKESLAQCYTCPYNPGKKQTNDKPEINVTGDIIEINGQIVQLFTSDELEEAARLFKKYEGKQKQKRYKRFLKSLHWNKTHDKQIKDASLYQGIDPVIIIDVLEKYNYTWYEEA